MFYKRERSYVLQMLDKFDDLSLNARDKSLIYQDKNGAVGENRTHDLSLTKDAR